MLTRTINLDCSDSPVWSDWGVKMPCGLLRCRGSRGHVVDGKRNALQDGLEWETQEQWQLDVLLDPLVDDEDNGAETSRYLSDYGRY
jgi:hypothetical protein